MGRLVGFRPEQDEAAKFRETAAALLGLPDNDWNDWEHDWLCDEVRRKPNYIYTDKERAILEGLRWNARSFSDYAGYGVSKLVAVAYRYRADLDEDGEDFVEKLHAANATVLKRRQIRRLAGICRLSMFIERDPVVDLRIPTSEADIEWEFLPEAPASTFAAGRYDASSSKSR